MANNISGLKTAIRNAFMANIDAATRVSIADAFVKFYVREWVEFTQQQGNADTPANRQAFAFNLWFKFSLAMLENVTKQLKIEEAQKTVTLPTVGIDGVETELPVAPAIDIATKG